MQAVWLVLSQHSGFSLSKLLETFGYHQEEGKETIWELTKSARGGQMLTQGARLTAIPSSPGSPGSPWETKNKQKRLINQVHWVADNQPQIHGHRNTLLQLGPLSRSALLKCMTWLHLTICCFPVNILDSRKQILQPWLNKISYFT